uniref:Putative capsid protein n=1 Tax=viral metagenome TaxID=1070528 RepID=A0A6M3LBD5_9ZZZZ
MALTWQPTDAKTGELIPEIWSTRIINHVRSNLICANVVDTTWKKEMSKGDILMIPLLKALSTGAVDTSNRESVNNENTTVTDTSDTITVDTWTEAVVMLDDSTVRQTHLPSLLAKLADNAAYALEKAIDTAVNAHFSSLTSTWAGADGQTFTDDLMINLMEGLDEADVPRENRSLVIDPSVIADIYRIDKFVHLNYQTTAVIPSGNIGQIYGVPVYVTNNLTATTTGNYGALLHKEAIALVMQEEFKVEKWRVPAAASDAIAVRCLYGEEVLRSTFGAYFYTRKK